MWHLNDDVALPHLAFKLMMMMMMMGFNARLFIMIDS